MRRWGPVSDVPTDATQQLLSLPGERHDDVRRHMVQVEPVQLRRWPLFPQHDPGFRELTEHLVGPPLAGAVAGESRHLSAAERLVGARQDS